MLHRAPRNTILTLVFALTLYCGGAVGCATQGEKMVKSYSQTRKNVTESRNQVGTTLVALNGLRGARGDNLKPAFRYYKDAVADLGKAGEEARQRAAALKESSDTHIEAWQNEMKGIKDPQIKSTLESRKAAVASNFTLVRMYADDAQKAFDPFLRSTQELLQALSIDLSPASISALTPVLDRVTAEGTALDQKLWMLQGALDNIANGISPLGNLD